jgi:hypothetical protein
MKFILALVGLTAAASVQLPEIDINTQKIESALNKLEVAGQKLRAEKEIDNRENAKNLVHAFATLKTAEYVNFGKTFKKWAEYEVAFTDAITVNAKCDQEAATECITKFYLTGFSDQTAARTKDICLKNAGCQLNYDGYDTQAKIAID